MYTPSSQLHQHLRRWLLGLFLLVATPACGQNIMWEWERVWGNGSDDILTGMVSLEDGTYLGLGFCDFPKHLGIVRITEYGDTIYSRSLAPMSSGHYTSNRLGRISTGYVYVAANNFLGCINPNDGSLIWYLRYLGVGPFNAIPNVNEITEGPNGTILLTGDCLDPVGNATSVGYVACYTNWGAPLWYKVLREHPDFTLCNHAELTPQGNILVSGTAGSRIWAVELQPNGDEIRRTTFYQSRSLRYFYYDLSWISQAPGDRYIVSGSIGLRSFYFGMHQGWGGPKIWGGEKSGGPVGRPVVNNDGSVLCGQYTNNTTRYYRLRADSTIRWSIPYPVPAGSRGAYFTLYAPAYDSSAIVAGAVSHDTTGADWYIAQISNAGVPYKPYTFVGTKPEVTSTLYTYPSPCRDRLGFSGLTQEGVLELFDAQGKRCLQKKYVPSQDVDLSILPSGLYQYGLRSAGKFYRGRIVKE